MYYCDVKEMDKMKGESNTMMAREDEVYTLSRRWGLFSTVEQNLSALYLA